MANIELLAILRGLWQEGVPASSQDEVTPECRFVAGEGSESGSAF
jgi:hypothetical protein